MGFEIPPAVATLLSTPWRNTTFAILPLLFVRHCVLRKPTRPRKVPKIGERVLVLGASSGVGRTLAKQYVTRGARVCVVGRRKALLDEVKRECYGTMPSLGSSSQDVLSIAADFTKAEDMVKVRALVEREWGGLDTLVVSAGVSALQPLMAVAGVEVKRGETMQEASQEGIQRAAEIAGAAVQGNYIGPLVAAVSFVRIFTPSFVIPTEIPLLSNTSKAPSIVLINSLASVIPAPTRTLYASTKAASLLLYQALSIEHPNITFTCVMPSTIEGDFRASAVDSGLVREKDPNKHGLKRDDVARRCIRAADYGEKAVFMPATMRFGHLLYWIWPSFVERRAMKKYNFSA
ncbi:hypothetical protein CVT26_000728 [Gymnopilus dilepis]|uniref:NAD(P)-binding protein n=1 Tax=Gymnopilus dilepis TaxID=231916 RepID=A0A409YU78_9AGAR|nr:hypothetical protein CVT26_000728 [Gymnopilus dilepis]